MKKKVVQFSLFLALVTVALNAGYGYGYGGSGGAGGHGGSPGQPGQPGHSNQKNSSWKVTIRNESSDSLYCFATFQTKNSNGNASCTILPGKSASLTLNGSGAISPTLECRGENHSEVLHDLESGTFLTWGEYGF